MYTCFTLLADVCRLITKGAGEWATLARRRRRWWWTARGTCSCRKRTARCTCPTWWRARRTRSTSAPSSSTDRTAPRSASASTPVTPPPPPPRRRRRMSVCIRPVVSRFSEARPREGVEERGLTPTSLPPHLTPALPMGCAHKIDEKLLEMSQCAQSSSNTKLSITVKMQQICTVYFKKWRA